MLGLEHRKRCLELGLAERRSEVGMQMELMQGEARLLREDLSRVTKELKWVLLDAVASCWCCR